MPREESAYLQDILVAAQQARTHARGLTFSEFTQSRLHRSRRVVGTDGHWRGLGSRQLRYEGCSSAIPWSQMTGMRNRIVHRYSRIDLDIVWAVVREGSAGSD